MNTFAVLCLLVCCVAVSMAQWQGNTNYLPRRHFPQTRYCTDYRGRLVSPGQSYSDGCNTCMCGSYGQPTYCTQRFCGGLPSHGLPVHQVLPSHGLPIRQVRPRAGGY
ncbi:uncharacterized protein LOC128226500 [Mya arenaria]|uniref:uncharacterized protein LOC128226500 n=1 Tax=Mya arenaria TaxID=6604 RepID=UPI0022E69EBC|nr:uncharacterized protein LOC128226500 [Mya arenaria]